MGQSTVKFGTAEVNGPEGPSTTIRARSGFVTEETADFTRVVYRTTTSKKDEWTLTLSQLTDAQKSALQTYFDDTAKGPTNTFTYEHTDGNTYTARFVDTELAWTRHGKTWDCTVRIEISARVND